MTEAQVLATGEPTQDDRTMAVLAQVLQLVGGWIAPLVIFLLKRQSRFVSFHALQVLLLQGVFILLTMLAGVGFFFAVALGLFSAAWSSQHSSSAPAAFFFLFFSFFWLAIMLVWVIKLVFAIVYGVKAGRGEWAEYPVLGRWARQILNIGPGGANLS
jgi:uncharacterized membrane protein